MPVRELAPALLALGDIFHEANTIANPDGAPVRLEIRAFRPGSFDVSLQLAHHISDAYHEVVTFLTTPDVTALEGLVGLVGGPAGVFALIKWMRRRRVARPPVSSDAGTTIVFAEDGSTFETASEVFELYQRLTVRRRANEVVAPLRQEGIDSVRLTAGQSPPVVVETADAEAFTPPISGEVALQDEEIALSLTITSLSFSEGNKWRLSDGSRIISARIEDEGFVARVNAAEEVFGKGDILRCRVRVQQWQSDNGLRTEYTVTQVLRHIEPARPMILPLYDDGGEPDQAPTLNLEGPSPRDAEPL